MLFTHNALYIEDQALTGVCFDWIIIIITIIRIIIIVSNRAKIAEEW